MKSYEEVRPSVECMTQLDYVEEIPHIIELAGRVCYKSESNMVDGNPFGFIERAISRGHESILEHGSITFRIVCDRGVSHELVRHRLNSFSQESTRYVNYGKRGIGMINPFPCFEAKRSPEMLEAWEDAMEFASNAYNKMIKLGAPPELARSVLPNSLKTELVMSGNPRQWRNFLKLRVSPKAHPQMREISGMIHKWFNRQLPCLVKDIPKVEV